MTRFLRCVMCRVPLFCASCFVIAGALTRGVWACAVRWDAKARRRPVWEVAVGKNDEHDAGWWPPPPRTRGPPRCVARMPTAAATAAAQSMEGVQNVYTRHSPLLSSILEVRARFAPLASHPQAHTRASVFMWVDGVSVNRVGLVQGQAKQVAVSLHRR